ncbi:MAG: hypothetical protein HY789_00145 [Deltaproteobacteria bacterium]|nr:hypothetical protein [Deltaproteobacteria bacterium]
MRPAILFPLLSGGGYPAIGTGWSCFCIPGRPGANIDMDRYGLAAGSAFHGAP